MGGRPGHPQGDRPRLGEDDSGDVAKLAANFVGQRLTCGRMGLAALVTLGKQGFEPRRRSADQLAGAPVEAALARWSGIRPLRGDRIVLDVRLGAASEPFDQA